MDAETIAARIKSGDYEECPYCKIVFEWSKLPDEKILTDKQAHPYGSTVAWETYVIGYICPECGYKVSL